MNDKRPCKDRKDRIEGHKTEEKESKTLSFCHSSNIWPPFSKKKKIKRENKT